VIPGRTPKASLRSLATSLLAFVILLTFGPAPAQSPNPDLVKVLMLPYLDFAPLHIADEEGYFAEQGIRIERFKFASSDHAVALLLRGDLDVAGSVVRVNLLNAMARDGSIAFVADKGHVAPAGGCPHMSLFARRTWLRDLKERKLDLSARISVSERPATIVSYYIEKALSTVAAGDRIERREIGEPAVAIEALRTGRLDVVFQAEPWRTLALQDPDLAEWMPDLEVIPDQQFALLVFGPRLIIRNPDIGERFMVAYLKGVRQYNQGKTRRNVDLLVSFTQLTEDVVRKACWPAIRDDGSINADKLVEFEAWAQTKGLLDRILLPARFWDGRFVAHANRVLAGNAAKGGERAKAEKR